MTKLSIITPTLNCAHYLGATLWSIESLCEQGAEHIIVDSDSTDGTLEMAKGSGATVLHCPRGNMYAAINKGMRSAKGEWLTYINGDDLLYADAIMEALRDVSNDISMVYGNIDYIDKYGRFLFPWRSPSVRWIHKFMAYYSPIPQQGTMFRSCVFKENNGFDTNFKYSADYDFWVRTLQAGFKPEKYKRKSIAGFRLMSEQLSQSQKGNMAPEGIAIRNRLKENLKPLEKFMMGSWATIYRVMTTLDSRFMRGKQGLDQDKRS